ncbi:hypothetical protein DFQ50_10115 [Pseudocitrobacter faecalis]|uniref:Uncharacterized protein n=1 Tax=Pseudocitrobacter faecalis TaxID=1398493 RepID=A0ABX9G596_9ENTR|nr:hypothetical protein DFQ50_10115 [Pseudocitrobacter faecalis]
MFPRSGHWSDMYASSMLMAQVSGVANSKCNTKMTFLILYLYE